MVTLGAAGLVAPADATGVTLTLYAPGGDAVCALSLTRADGVWGGTRALDPAPPDADLPYTYAAVAATPHGPVTVAAGAYGYLTRGEWYEAAAYGGPGYVGTLTSQAALDVRFGAANVSAYSNENGATTGALVAAVERAIRWAEGYVFACLGRLYATPFVWAGGVVDPVAEEWATVLAGWWLYTKRGWRDEEKGGDLGPLRAEVLRELKLFAAGVRQLDAARAGAAAGGVTGFSGYVPWTDASGRQLDRNATAALESGLPAARLPRF